MEAADAGSQHGVVGGQHGVNAMRRVLRAGTGSDSLYRDALELLGHSRMTKRVNTLLGSALEFGIQSGRLPADLLRNP